MIYDVVIVGGGISGCICADRLNAKKVLIIDNNSQLMKKILSTGNGRCNLLNEVLSCNYYHSDDIGKVENILTLWDNHSFKQYLYKIGIVLKNINNCYYPNSLQASSVVNILSGRLESSSVTINLNEEVLAIDKDELYGIKTTKGVYYANKVVLACGTRASNINNSSKIAEIISKKNKFRFIKNLPALCPMLTNKSSLNKLQGLRVDAQIRLIIEDELIKEEVGTVQFTKEAVSGIVVFQVSSLANRALDNGKRAYLSIDYFYGLNKEKCISILEQSENLSLALEGILPKKLAKYLVYITERKGITKKSHIETILRVGANHLIEIKPNYDCSHAQVLSGGYELKSLSDNLELANKGLFVIGEIVNVDGICGGYNIQWAYSSASVVSDYINRVI